MEKPKITVITVTFNAEKVLEKTILSVINQTYDNIEYIIIDGASTDRTMDIVKKYSNRISIVVSEPDKGIYDAMNKGIKLATGDWINFMNSGDGFHSNDVLEKFVPQIEDDTVIAYGDVNLIFQSAELKVKPQCLEFLKEGGMSFCHQSCLVKTSYHKEHLFDISFKIAADYNLFYNAYVREGIKFQYIPVLISDFDAEDGVSSSSKNYRFSLSERARVQGIDKQTIWRLKYLYLVSFHKIKQLIKPFFSDKFLSDRKIRMIADRP